MGLPEHDRLSAGREVVYAKDAKGLSWQQLADALDRSLVWTTSALLGQQPLDAEQAQRVGGLLGLDDDTVAALSLPPVRGEAALDPTEPVTYRLQEALQVYSGALHELIREEFGDGIMSAIDFSMSFEREEDPKGDRVKLVWSGKFLPYKVF
ncbi:cyanase [Actinomycetospora termitidis]|uniref:Cyanate hydratase n=1 Tax=Actinomycetospora termitidis TaxID=3053470 RepID=A0ABT7M5T3_9PSEU|nr:cyanase [Actinomycetospora sp. Odt1-22]MDL5155816.1 cyanase [Actinomycetospora sp. Odt1-22]